MLIKALPPRSTVYIGVDLTTLKFSDSYHPDLVEKTIPFHDALREKGLFAIWTVLCYMEERADFYPVTNDNARDLAAEFSLAIVPKAGDFVSTKPYLDPFQNPRLAEHLIPRGITSAIISGRYVDCCVPVTAVGADQHGIAPEQNRQDALNCFRRQSRLQLEVAIQKVTFATGNEILDSIDCEPISQRNFLRPNVVAL